MEYRSRFFRARGKNGLEKSNPASISEYSGIGINLNK